MQNEKLFPITHTHTHTHKVMFTIWVQSIQYTAVLIDCQWFNMFNTYLCSNKYYILIGVTYTTQRHIFKSYSRPDAPGDCARIESYYSNAVGHAPSPFIHLRLTELTIKWCLEAIDGFQHWDWLPLLPNKMNEWRGSVAYQHYQITLDSCKLNSYAVFQCNGSHSSWIWVNVSIFNSTTNCASKLSAIHNI